MLKRLVAYAVGTLRIEISGGRIERFLNLAVEHGLSLWDIERSPDRTRATLTIGDFFALRPVARGARCRVQVLRRHGLPFQLVKVRRRPALIAGAMACLAFIAWASSHVWIVEVRISGPQNLDKRAVAAVAAEAGLRVGAWKSQVDLNRIQEHIQERMGEVSRAVIRMQGTRAVVEVVEKKARTRIGEDGCINLVARKGGVIEEVVPFRGEPKVKKGDIVQPNTVLVECSFKYWKDGRPLAVPGTELPPRESVARNQVAQAIVRARVSYSRFREVPLVQTVEVPTGRQTSQWVLKWKDKPIILRGEEEIPFARYQEDRHTYGLPGWRNWKPPVELVMLRANEVEIRREPIPEAQALQQAKADLESQLRWILGPSDKILTPLTAEVIDRGNDYLGILVTVETLEEIAQPREGAPIPVPPPQNASPKS